VPKSSIEKDMPMSVSAVSLSVTCWMLSIRRLSVISRQIFVGVYAAVMNGLQYAVYQVGFLELPHRQVYGQTDPVATPVECSHLTTGGGKNHFPAG